MANEYREVNKKCLVVLSSLRWGGIHAVQMTWTMWLDPPWIKFGFGHGPMFLLIHYWNHICIHCSWLNTLHFWICKMIHVNLFIYKYTHSLYIYTHIFWRWTSKWLGSANEWRAKRAHHLERRQSLPSVPCKDQKNQHPRKIHNKETPSQFFAHSRKDPLRMHLNTTSTTLRLSVKQMVM